MKRDKYSSVRPEFREIYKVAESLGALSGDKKSSKELIAMDWKELTRYISNCSSKVHVKQKENVVYLQQARNRALHFAKRAEGLELAVEELRIDLGKERITNYRLSRGNKKGKPRGK